MDRRSLFGVVIFTASCAPGDGSVFIRPAWDSSAIAVAILLDASDQPAGTEPSVIAPGAVVKLDAHVPGDARLYIATYAPRAEFARCTVTLGSSGSLLDAPLGAWRSPPLEDANGVLELEVVRDPPSFELRFDRCDDTCDQPIVERITGLDFARGGFQVAAYSRDRAFFGGNEVSAEDQRTAWGRIDGTVASALPFIPGAALEMSGLGFSADGRLHGVTHNGHAFLADAEGRIIRTATVGNGVAGSAIAADGTSFTWLLNDGGVFEAGPELEALELRPDFPRDIRQMVAVRRDLVAVFANGGPIDVYEGDSFRRESEGGDRPEYAAAAGDENILVVLPRYLPMLRRDATSRTWGTMARPFDSFPRTMAAFGPGRLIAAGRNGALAIFDGESWCKVQTNSTGQFLDVSVSLDGTTAFAVGVENDAAFGVRISM